MPIGTLTKKIQRQPMPVVRTPPSSGPAAVLIETTAPQTPKATPRALPWKVCASSASEVAKIVAPPIPWRARKAISIAGDWARPQSSEAAVKMTSPTAKARRRP